MDDKDILTVDEYKDLLKNSSSLERAFEYQIVTLGQDLPSIVRHYSDWHPDRNWEFDFAYVDQKVAIELEGGGHGVPVYCHNCGVQVRAKKKDGSPGKAIRIAGWHARPARFLSDVEKYNEAQRLGWIVLRFTNVDVNGDPFQMVDYIRVILEHRQVQTPMIEGLTKREMEILHMIAAGFVTAEIATRLDLADNTIRSYAQKICQKLNVCSRSAAVARAAAWGLLDYQAIPWPQDPMDAASRY